MKKQTWCQIIVKGRRRQRNRIGGGVAGWGEEGETSQVEEKGRGQQPGKRRGCRGVNITLPPFQVARGWPR